MDQQFFPGIGNCYADELCWAAGIHPLRVAGKLSTAEQHQLWQAMRATLSEAVALGGYTETPFQAGDRFTGGYLAHLKVYDRGGEPCLRCGDKIVQAEASGRKLFFCPHCQPSAPEESFKLVVIHEDRLHDRDFRVQVSIKSGDEMAYLLMAVVGLGMLLGTAATYERKGSLLAKYAVALALVLLADWIAFGWFRLYEYHPGLVKNQLVDAALGEFTAELIFVPSLAVCLDRYLPGIKGAVAGALLVSLIEAIMVRQKTFRQCGWQVWYTTVGFTVYFTVLHEFWDAVYRGAIRQDRVLRLIRLSLVFDAIGHLTLLLRAYRLVHTNLHIMPTELGNQALGRFLTYALVTVPLGYWVAGGSGIARWWRAAGAAVAIAGFNLLLTVTNLQQFRPPYSATADVVAEMAAILAAAYIQDRVDLSGIAAGTRLHRV